MTPISNGNRVFAWIYNSNIYSIKGDRIGEYEHNNIFILGKNVANVSDDLVYNKSDEEVGILLSPSALIKVGSQHDIKSLRKPIIRFSSSENRKEALDFLNEISSVESTVESSQKGHRLPYKKFLLALITVIATLLCVDYVYQRFFKRADTHDVSNKSSKTKIYTSSQSTSSKPATKNYSTHKTSQAVINKEDKSSLLQSSNHTKHSIIDSPLKKITEIGHMDVYKSSVNSKPFIVFERGLQIDADGSPRAYGPDGKGLDYLANAGHPGNWWGVITDKQGIPVVQSDKDPAPGYYVSTTSLQDPTFNIYNPNRYVNSEEIPFIVLPIHVLNWLGETKLSDIAVVWNKQNNKISYGIVADVGPENQLGEGSIKLAKELGVNSSPKIGGQSSHIVYFIFPNSGTGKIDDKKTITDNASSFVKSFGGVDNLRDIWTERTINPF